MLEDARHGRKAESFTLQWHLTNSCEMECRHCYDRTQPSPLVLDEALRVVDGLLEFCSRRGVRPGVGLSGGNPFLFHGFFDLYRRLADRDVPVSILGNPVRREWVERLVEIRKPTYYQVSLEGLEAHNDEIRGPGSYRRAIEFLPVLRELGIRATVMLTLTRANMDQVLPLARLLRGKAGRFAWNRLSQTGNGAALQLPSREAYGELLVRWLAEAKDDPGFGLKDNLFNILRHELGHPLTGGCTGQGCGAAFNFFALLPDGEAHACRKFPSPIGNLLRLGFDGVYDSEAARRYRRGCVACDGCAIRTRCGGCLAVAAGQGLDPFTERDPFCFMD